MKKLTILTTTESIFKVDSQAYAFFITSLDLQLCASYANEIFGDIIKIANIREFKCQAGSSLIINGFKNGSPVYLMLFGIESKANDLEYLRRAIGLFVRSCESYKITKAAINFVDHEYFKVSILKIAEEIASILEIANYSFDDFITNKKIDNDFEVTISCQSSLKQGVDNGISHGKLIGESVNLSRTWCDMPPSKLNPTDLANNAIKIAEENNLIYKVFSKQDLESLKMEGILGVAAGSDQEPKMVILEYKSKNLDAKTVAIVGKGITFDSGGLSIKPAESMETMKDDMAGAAVVISTMRVIANLKPDLNIIAIAPITENLINGSATKPGDVLTFYNGKTAEVKNTDAEGRLVLADALSYAVKNYKLDAIIDIATLTGSCMAALGPVYCGLMGLDEILISQIEQAGKLSGDKAWNLPMHEDYKNAIKSDIADISNIGNKRYMSGAITAAWFLSNFVDNVPWVHLDIAGVAFSVPDRSYYRSGATGFGVRLLSSFLTSYK